MPMPMNYFETFIWSCDGCFSVCFNEFYGYVFVLINRPSVCLVIASNGDEQGLFSGASSV